MKKGVGPFSIYPKSNSKPLQSILTQAPIHWNQSYRLIDSGDFEKLEQFGPYCLRRPEPQALWPKSLTENEWQERSHAHFKREKGNAEKGLWHCQAKVPDKWYIPYLSPELNLRFKISLSSFKHVGLFPEQAANWDFLAQNLGKLGSKPKVLNLFAYTGGASLACQQVGGLVTHVDSVKPVLSWARDNMEQSGLDGIRWMAEDALKFVKKEARRGNQYQAILLDPPAYGRGPDGEKWVLEEQILSLLQEIKAILAPERHLVLGNFYSMGFSTLVIHSLMDSIFPEPAEKSAGELFLSDEAGRALPLGVFHRYLKID